MPEFLLRAWLAGIGVAAVAGPLGCFVLWRNMAYYGETLAHGALLGVTLGLLTGLDVTPSIALACVAIAIIVVLAERQRELSTDTVLGILASSSLAIGIVSLAAVDGVRVDLLGYLFGDILAVGWLDVAVVNLGGGLVLAVVWRFWSALVFTSLDPDMARAEGIPTYAMRLLLMMMIALLVAGAMKIIGILLITSMLVIPPAAARQWTRSPEGMAAAASLVGALAVTLGLLASYRFDSPAGASIVVASLVLFSLARLARAARAMVQAGAPDAAWQRSNHRDPGER